MANLPWSSNEVKQATEILSKFDRIIDALPTISHALRRNVTANSLKAAFLYRRGEGVQAPSSYLGRPSFPAPVRSRAVEEEDDLGELEEELDQLEDEEDEDPLEKHIRAREARTAKSREKELLERLREAQERQSVLAALDQPFKPLRIKAREKTSGLREGTAVILASDWHVEEVVDPQKVAGRNSYNLAIAKRRCQRFFEGITSLNSFTRNKFSIRDVILWLGGDLMTGFIHEELVETNDLGPIETILELRTMLVGGIDYLLQDPKIESLKIPCSFGNHGRCHDDQTELLTADGWKSYDQLAVGDLVATYDMSTGQTVWQPLQDVYVDHYEGSMVKVDTATADFMVTPHHRMVVRSHKGEDQFIEMQDFVAKGTMGSYNWPKCAAGQDEELSGVLDDELRLLGWIMTDGSYATMDSGVRAIRLYQSKPQGVECLKGLLQKMGVEHGVHVRPRKPPVILGRQVQSTLEENTFSLTVQASQRFLELMPSKREVPAWMRELSRRQFSVFLDGLMAGDGHARTREGKGEERVLYGERDVLSSIQMLAVTNGIAARLREDNRGNYILSLPTSVRGHINDWEGSVKTVPYCGTIWCGTVANGTLITRRNGIPLVSGNTTHKRRSKTGAENSYEWLLYNILKLHYQNEPRVEFAVDKSAHQYVDAYDFRLHFHHGDTVRSMGGVGGISIPLNKRIPKWDNVLHSDYHHVGHFHTFIDLGRTVVNGSLIGYSEYAFDCGFDYEVPQQAYYVLDSKRGKCLPTPIWVDDDAALHNQLKKAV